MATLTTEQQLAAFDRVHPPGRVGERARQALRRLIEEGWSQYDPLTDSHRITLAGRRLVNAGQAEAAHG